MYIEISEVTEIFKFKDRRQIHNLYNLISLGGELL